MQSLHQYITTFDWILGFIYFALVLFAAGIYKNTYHKNDSIYKYFIPGLAAKILGGIALISIYAYYYRGGDIFAYFHNTEALVKLFVKDPISGIKFLFGNNSNEGFALFNTDTGIPHFYLYKDSQTWAVSRFSFPFALFSFNFIIPATILMNIIAFIGPWKFAKTLHKQYPLFKKSIVFAIIFLPSCLFWGSGLMKDSFTLSATLWIFASLIKILKEKEKIWINILLIIINAYIIISIKPYIFVAMMPAIILFFSFSFINKIRNKFIKYLSLPVILILVIIGGFSLFSALSSSLGVYGSIDESLKKVAVSKQDFTQNKNYGDNYFDIGEIDPSLGGIMSKAHLALLHGLFGPFPWKAKNPVMILSALEALLVFFLFIKMLYYIFFKGRGKLIVQDNIVFSFLIFVLIFIIFVGTSTANYGSLVRYRIPAYPLFIFILLYVNSRQHHNKEIKQKEN